MRLRVLTFNVQNDEGDPRRPELINRLLLEHAPDLLVLQEVRYPDHLGRLLRGTGLTATHQDEVLRHRPPGADRYGGTALASRWPHRVHRIIESDPAAPFHYWTLTASLPVPRGPELVVATLTTPWEPEAAPTRLLQARATGPAGIIAGDLNATPAEDSVRHLIDSGYVDAWAAAGDGPGHTWSPTGGAPTHRIDYVLVAPGTATVRAARLVGTEPVDGVRLSDHVGLLADLDLPTTS